MHILFYIYLVGSLIALFIGIYEVIHFNQNHTQEEKNYGQYGMLATMVICSWITVITYFYAHYVHKKFN